MRTFNARLALSATFLLTISTLAGCASGGGGNPGVSPALPAVNPGKTLARITITIPPKPAAVTSSRSPAYVSPSTQSITVKVDSGLPVAQNLTPGSPNCGVSAPLAPLTCTVDIGATPGSHTFTFSTYDQTNATGNQLSVNSAVQTLNWDQITLVNVTLAGVQKAVLVAPLPGANGIGGNQAMGLTYLFGTKRMMLINAVDADGNYIIGPGAPTIHVTASGTTAANFSAAPSGNGNPNEFGLFATTSGSGTLAITSTPQSSLAGAPMTLTVPVTSTVLVSTLDGNAGVSVGKVAGAGFVDGVSTIAKLYNPYSIAYDSTDGNLYMGDICTIRQETISGTVTSIAGSFPSYSKCGVALDGTGATSTGPPQFSTVIGGIAYDSVAGALYVDDTNNNVVRTVIPSGVVTTLAGAGPSFIDGQGAAAGFSSPGGITYDPDDGNFYVADTGNCAIRRVTPSGAVTTIAGGTPPAVTCGYADGSGSAARFSGPSGITYDSSDHNLYVSDRGNCSIRKVTLAGVVTTIAGAPPSAPVCALTDGIGTSAQFAGPNAIAYDPVDGNFYIIDFQTSVGSAVRQSTPSGVVTTIAGSATAYYRDGLGTTALFSAPIAITVDPVNGMLYVADAFRIRQVQL